MAQAVLKVVIGQEVPAFTPASNATNISTDSAWLIFAAGVDRDVAAKILDDARLRILDGATTWPMA